MYEDYPSRPGDYLAHMIGHEGENSLLSLLKKKNLATELSAGTSSHYMFNSFILSLFSWRSCVRLFTLLRFSSSASMAALLATKW